MRIHYVALRPRDTGPPDFDFLTTCRPDRVMQSNDYTATIEDVTCRACRKRLLACGFEIDDYKSSFT